MSKLPMNDPVRAQEFFEEKLAFLLGPLDLNLAMDEGRDFNLIDVRDWEDYFEGHLPGAINLPEDRWEFREGLAKDQVNVFYSYSPSCYLSAKAAAFFASAGFSVMVMDGGFDSWEDLDLDVECGPGISENPAA